MDGALLLGEQADPAGEIGEGCAGLGDRAEDLEGREDPVPAPAVLAHDDVAALLAAEPRPGDPELEQTLLEISRLLRNAQLMHRNLEHQKTLAAVTEQSADAIYTTDQESRIMSWNTAAEQLFGYPPGEALGKPLHFLVPKDRLTELDERNAQALAEGSYGRDGVLHATVLQAKCASKYAPAQPTAKPAQPAAAPAKLANPAT